MRGSRLLLVGAAALALGAAPCGAPRALEPAGAAAGAPADVLALLEAWRSAWERQDLGAYLAFYAPDATSAGRSFDAHRAHKAALFARGEPISIALGDVEVDAAPPSPATVTVRFDQDYRSPSLSDFGRKELRLRSTPAGLRIVSETWRAAPSGRIETPLASTRHHAPDAPPVTTPRAAPPAGKPTADDELEPLVGEGYVPPPDAQPPSQAPVDDLLDLEPLQPSSPASTRGFLPGIPIAENGREVIEEIVARVNGRILTRSMFLDRVDLHHQRLLLEDPPDLAERIASLVHDTLETTIERWLLLQEAKDRQADIEAFWRDWLVQTRKQVGAEDMKDLEDLLREQGTTLAALKEQVVESEVPNLFIHREILERIDLSDERLKEHYAENPAAYQVPARVTLRQVLVPVTPGESPDRAEAVARQALARLQAGEDWCDVHAIHGQGPRCGDVGTVALSDLLPELRDAARGLPIDAVSKTIRSSVGVHVVQVTSREEPRLLPFEEVKDRVREDLFNRARDERLAELLDDLRRRGEIEVNPRYAKAAALETTVSR